MSLISNNILSDTSNSDINNLDVYSDTLRSKKNATSTETETFNSKQFPPVEGNDVQKKNTPSKKRRLHLKKSHIFTIVIIIIVLLSIFFIILASVGVFDKNVSPNNGQPVVT